MKQSLKRLGKRIGACILIGMMLINLVPVSIFASEGNMDIKDEVYQIEDAADLMAFAELVNEGNSDINGELQANIDLSGEAWVPIGMDSYTGTFNGNNFTISNMNLEADNGDYWCVGLFADAEGTIENLKVTGKIVCESEGIMVGGIAGYGHDATIQNCSSSVEIVSTGAYNRVGGIVGGADEVTVTQCVNRGKITADDAEGAGGIIGGSDMGVELSYSMNQADIIAEGSEDTFAGGLMGVNYSVDTTITACYSTATVDEGATGIDDLATNKISASYAGDVFGSNGGYDRRALQRIGVFCDGIDGEGQVEFGDDWVYLREYSGFTMEDVLTTLNGDEEPAVFVQKDGSGWPMLAWELKEAQNAGEAEEALRQAKAEAKQELDAAYQSYQEADYRQKDWTTLTEIYQAAGEAIEAVTVKQYTDTPDILTKKVEEAKAQMAAVLTREENEQKELQEAKTQAIQDIMTAYQTDVTSIETTEASLEQKGYWHDYLEAAKELIASSKVALEEKKTTATTAIQNCETISDVATALSAGINAMQESVDRVSQYQPDTGIPSDQIWDGTTETKPSGQGTKASPYQITNGSELAWFSSQVNAGKTQLSAVITKDIDLGGHIWTPIYQSASGNGYRGSFDGGNHIIHNMNADGDKDATTPTGLFGYIGTNGTVQNVKVAGTVTSANKNGAGAIAGTSSGIIYNCVSSVYMRGNNASNPPWYLGGIAGIQNGGIIDSCENYSRIEYNSYIQYVGGIAGNSTNKGMIRYCTNYGDVIIQFSGGTGSGTYIGGILGASDGEAYIRECANYGTVIGGSHVGGIMGAAIATKFRGKLNVSVDYVVNYGSVYGDAGVNQYFGGTGGIIGLAGRESVGSQYYTSTKVSVSHAYNVGTIQTLESVGGEIKTDPTGKRCGALIGNWLGGTVTESQSSSDKNRLWGYADAEETIAENAVKVDAVSIYSSTKDSGAAGMDKVTASAQLLAKLKKSDDAVYGEQYVVYNQVVFCYLREIEAATSSEEIQQVLAEFDLELQQVPTALASAQYQLKADLDAYVAARIYDEDTLLEIQSFVAGAKDTIDAATTIAGVNNLRQQYLGTEYIDGDLAAYETYDVKATRELYDEFIYGKNYSTEDLAKIFYEYQYWEAQIQLADNWEGIELAYTSGRQALTQLVSTLTEAEAAGDLAEAKATALAMAQASAAEEMQALIQEKTDAIKAQVEAAALASHWKSILETEYQTGSQTIQNAYTANFEACASRAEVTETLAEQKQAVEAAYESVAARLSQLISAAQAVQEQAWDGSTIQAPAAGNGTKEDPYQITCGAELAWLSEQVNQVNNYSSEYYAILMNDIDLGCCAWTPIGYKDSYLGSYRWEFNGQGHTVYGLRITDIPSGSTKAALGLFGVVQRGGKVQGVNVQGSIQLDSVNVVSYVGGIAGYMAYGTSAVQDCSSAVDITVQGFTSSTTDSSRFGGIVGYGNGDNVEISNCAYTGNLTVTSPFVTTNIAPKGIGGIVGEISGTTVVRNCTNLGTIQTERSMGTGGIVGYIGGYGNKKITIEKCGNQGSISASPEKTPTYLGGILGIANGSYGSVLVQGCYNTGSITGRERFGGILGSESTTVGSQSGCPGLEIQNCYNAGKLIGPNNQGGTNMGGLAGYPIDGRYRTNLYVISGTAKRTMGYKSSQGDYVQMVSNKELEAVFPIQELGMVSSFAGLNEGYPLYPKEVLLASSRKKVTNYLNQYYTENLIGYLPETQLAQVYEELQAQLQIIAEAATYAQVRQAYDAAMALMNSEDILKQAKASALAELESLQEGYLVSYPSVRTNIIAFTEQIKGQIEQAASPLEISQALISYNAGIVDILIRDIGVVDKDMTIEQAATVKNKLDLAQAAYDALSVAEKRMVSEFISLDAAKKKYQLYLNYQVDLEAVCEVTNAIRAIGTVSLSSADSINHAKELYNKLTTAQRQLLSAEVEQILIQAIAEYNRLRAEADNQPNPTPTPVPTPNPAPNPTPASDVFPEVVPTEITNSMASLSDAGEFLKQQVTGLKEQENTLQEVDSPLAINDLSDNGKDTAGNVENQELGTGNQQNAATVNWQKILLTVVGILAAVGGILAMGIWFFHARQTKRN